MSRKIDFRAWFNDKMYWQEYCGGFSYFIEPTSCDQEEQDAFSLEEIFVWSKDGKCILQQNTGLTDSTGKEIYEGDILAYKNGNFLRGKDGFDDRLEVFWDNENSKFGINFFSKHGGEGYTGKSEHLCSYAKETQIIGNIFETPELLV